DVHAAARARLINLREIDADTVGISLDETTTQSVIADVAACVDAPIGDRKCTPTDASDTGLGRTSEFMTHAAFTSHRSEHQMLRYLRALADRDLALDRTMIPLGSCTMKLNATSEMEPITWPEWGQMHPFAPVSQARGYLQLLADL